MQLHQTMVSPWNNNNEIHPDNLSEIPKQANEKNNTTMGQQCPVCYKTTFALFRNRTGQLVCRRCKHKKKSIP